MLFGATEPGTLAPEVWSLDYRPAVDDLFCRLCGT